MFEPCFYGDLWPRRSLDSDLSQGPKVQLFARGLTSIRLVRAINRRYRRPAFRNAKIYGGKAPLRVIRPIDDVRGTSAIASIATKFRHCGSYRKEPIGDLVVAMGLSLVCKRLD